MPISFNIIFIVMVSYYATCHYSSLRHKSVFKIRNTYLKSEINKYGSAGTNNIRLYKGPVSDIQRMEWIYSQTNTGIQISVGPSLIGQGRGLFFSLPKHLSSVVALKGTQVCDYNEGSFYDEELSNTIYSSDKCVDFTFTSIFNGLIFNNTVMPLIDVIVGIYDPNRHANDKDKYISKLVYGHILSSNDDGDLHIVPDKSVTKRIYIPYNASVSSVHNSNSNVTLIDSASLSNMFGIYANDYGFNNSLIKSKKDESVYNTSSASNNILTLLWKVAVNEMGILYPVCPVVVVSQDVNFTNQEPECMEVGLHYGWDYWASFLPDSSV